MPSVSLFVSLLRLNPTKAIAPSYAVLRCLLGTLYVAPRVEHMIQLLSAGRRAQHM